MPQKHVPERVTKASVMFMPIRISYTDMDDSQYGCCDEGLGLIEIDNNLSVELELKTLIHELVHLYGSSMMGKDLSESTVVMIESIIWMMVMENKQLTERLYILATNRKR